MTNINCSKECAYQKDGKCACDNVILPFFNANIIGDADCPYLSSGESKKETVVQ